MTHTGTLQQAPHAGPARVAPGLQALLTVGALVAPPLLMLAVGVTLGEGHELLRTLDGVPVLGAVVLGLVRGIVWLYSLDLQAGGMTPLLSFNVLYLVFAALLARRRLWVPSAVVLLVPLAAFWYLASILQD